MLTIPIDASPPAEDILIKEAPVFGGRSALNASFVKYVFYVTVRFVTPEPPLGVDGFDAAEEFDIAGSAEIRS